MSGLPSLHGVRASGPFCWSPARGAGRQRTRKEPTKPTFKGRRATSALAPGSRATALDVFPIVRSAAVSGAAWILVGSGMGGALGHPVGSPDGAGNEGRDDGVILPPGGGVAGLCRTVAREVPGAVVRAVDFDPKADHESVASALLEELLLEDPDDLTLREMLAPGGVPQQTGFEPLGPLSSHDH